MHNEVPFQNITIELVICTYSLITFFPGSKIPNRETIITPKKRTFFFLYSPENSLLGPSFKAFYVSETLKGELGGKTKRKKSYYLLNQEE